MSGPVRNRWIVERDPMVTWYATLPIGSEHGRWRQLALTRGAELGVFRVQAVPEIAFDVVRDRTLDAFLAAHPDLDDGAFVLSHTLVASSRVAVVAAAGVVEEEFTDLGAALEAAPFAAPMRHRPPLELRASNSGDGDIHAVVSTCSDIWLPWSSARYEPGAELTDFGDNRELARRHTPRLNQWLAELRNCALDLGGTWALDRDDTDRDLLFQLDDDGVVLDASQPFVRDFHAPVRGPGAEGVLAALRSAAEWIRTNPPRPPYRAVLRAVLTDAGHELAMADHEQLRRALRESDARPTRAELSGVAVIQVDNGTDRHTFTVDDLVT